MGKRGPKKGHGGRTPLPTALKALRGTLKPSRANAREPVAPPGAPPVPSYLDRQERRRWRELVALLDSMGVLSRGDGTMLADLVVAEVRVARANKLCQDKGTYVTDDQGRQTIAPWAQERHRAQMLVRQLGPEFGISPSSRQNISSTVADAPPTESEEDQRDRAFFFAPRTPTPRTPPPPRSQTA